MNIQFLRAADKFQLTEDYVSSWSNWRGDVTKYTYPKGLVFTLVNYTSNYQSDSIKLKTIIDKKVVAECYNGIPESAYKVNYSWRSSKTPKTIILSNLKEMKEFFSKLQSFDEEYLRITGQFYKTDSNENILS